MYRILAGPTLLAVACLLLAGCHRREAAQMSNSARDARIQVTPIKPLRKTLVRYCELPGQTAPLEEAPLLAKVTGYVRKIHVDIGDRVTGPVYVDGARQQLG
jgi:multidrug efflux pump subunit AcrA (membrane-fusion protein)